MSIAVASVVGCCCGEQLPPCVGCGNAVYQSPTSAVSVSLALFTNGAAAHALFGFTGLYTPFVVQGSSKCRWIDTQVKVVEVPATNGLGYYRWTIRGVVVQPQISGNQTLGYGVYPHDLSGFNGWAFFLNDGTFGGGSASFIGAIVGKVLCTASPMGDYGVVGPTTSYGVVS